MRLLLVFGLIVALAIPASSGGAERQLQVVTREFSFQLSRTKVRKGNVALEVANFGSDPHDVKLQKWNGTGPVVGTGEVGPGARGEVTVKLKGGRYRMWCSITNHRFIGMDTVLVVTDD